MAGALTVPAGAGARTAALVRAVNAALILLADHELATSTVAVRVAASARADLYDALLAGLGVVAGPLHGGASQLAYGLVRDAEQLGPERALDDTLRWQHRLPGFGHAVYRGDDPRFTVLKGLVDDAVAAGAAPDPRHAVGAGRRAGHPGPQRGPRARRAHACRGHGRGRRPHHLHHRPGGGVDGALPRGARGAAHPLSGPGRLRHPARSPASGPGTVAGATAPALPWRVGGRRTSIVSASERLGRDPVRLQTPWSSRLGPGAETGPADGRLRVRGISLAGTTPGRPCPAPERRPAKARRTSRLTSFVPTISSPRHPAPARPPPDRDQSPTRGPAPAGPHGIRDPGTHRNLTASLRTIGSWPGGRQKPKNRGRRRGNRLRRTPPGSPHDAYSWRGDSACERGKRRFEVSDTTSLPLLAVGGLRPSRCATPVRAGVASGP